MQKKKLPLSFCMRFARSAKQVTTRKFTYPMSLPGFQEVFMPSLMPIGPKLWALEGYSHSRSIHVLHSYLVCFAHVRFTLTKIFQKKVCLNRLEML